MNPKLDYIFSRRSIRSYKETAVDESLINDLLEAAMAAPSACEKDPWHFMVITEPDIRNSMADYMPNGQMLREAPVAILVCGDISKAHREMYSFMIQDCSAAIENILLAAETLGLGACWIGIHPRVERLDAVTEQFNLPEHITPISVISIGYADETKEPRTRFSTDVIHRNKW